MIWQGACGGMLLPLIESNEKKIIYAATIGNEIIFNAAMKWDSYAAGSPAGGSNGLVAYPPGIAAGRARGRPESRRAPQQRTGEVILSR